MGQPFLTLITSKKVVPDWGKGGYKWKDGITLIALVITIIVLLILAGVTLNLMMSENGVIGKAQEAKEKKSISEDYSY